MKEISRYIENFYPSIIAEDKFKIRCYGDTDEFFQTEYSLLCETLIILKSVDIEPIKYRYKTKSYDLRVDKYLIQEFVRFDSLKQIYYSCQSTIRLIGNCNYLFCMSKFYQDISTWDTSKLTHADYMFTYSKYNHDISGWDTSAVVSKDSMFKESEYKKDIYYWGDQILDQFFARVLEYDFRI